VFVDNDSYKHWCGSAQQMGGKAHERRGTENTKVIPCTSSSWKCDWINEIAVGILGRKTIVFILLWYFMTNLMKQENAKVIKILMWKGACEKRGIESTRNQTLYLGFKEDIEPMK
jgi:hypothetical protein